MSEAGSSAAFVGRGTEVERLRNLVAGVASGHGGVAWVEGEPGIGKSALVAAGLAEAAGLGCAVFAGTADQLRARFPLGVLLDCLGVQARSAGGERGMIAALLRGEGMGGVMPAGDAVVAAAERVIGLVDRLCAVSPVVLVLDDLQWADEVSVSVWHRLAGGTGQVPLLVVGVSRPVPRSAAVMVARQAVVARGGVLIPVAPLPEAEVSALVAGLVGARPGPGLLKQAGRAGGNPLYVREVVDALLREHHVQVSGGLAEMTVAAGTNAQAPTSLAAAIEDRLGFLSGRAVEVLRIAALLGVRFSVRDLAVVAGVEGSELARVVGEAVAAGVLIASGMDLEFRHGLIAQALADGMPAGLRAELRGAAARALADSRAAPERVAAQLLEAGAQEYADAWAVEWLAAHAAALVHRAPQVAADLLTRVAAGVTAGDPGHEVLTEHLAGVLFLLARYESAEPVTRALLAQTSDPQRRARMGWTLTYILVRTGRTTEALAAVDQALQDKDAPDKWRARLRSVRAVALVNDSRLGEADTAAADALADAERAGDQFAAGYALHVQSFARSLGGDGPGALEITERALAVIGDDPETTDLRLLLLNNRLTALSNLDREADSEARQLLTLAEQAGTARISMVRGTVAQYLFAAGRWDDALAELAALLEPGADVISAAILAGRGLAALIAGHRDDRADAATQLRAAEEVPGLGEDRGIYGVDLLRARAMAAEQDERPGDAMDYLATALAEAELGEAVELHWRADLVRCAMAADDQAVAEAAVARCEEGAAGRQGGSVRRYGSSVAAARWCRGLLDADPMALAEAVAYYRAVARPLELGQSLEDLAVALAVRADVAAARPALREAVELYAGLGAEWDILRADTRVRPYGVRRRRSGKRRPETGWAALTPTETKVAYLVGQGLSNPEIGKRLFLSRYTVQVHVSKILAKLQVRSRVEVAGQVARLPAESRPLVPPPDPGRRGAGVTARRPARP